jgi:endogenous inhibitor of DNA gyrase (YacG/DUF329 family)
MAEFSVEIYCPECYTVINAKLSDLHPGGSTKCPKCGTNVKFGRDDLARVRKELEKLENTIKQFET